VQKTVEDVTGEPFATAMSELVPQPLGMTRSNFQQPPQARTKSRAATDG
jgi:CubicO group peptidase (beta-lactamase class C family)